MPAKEVWRHSLIRDKTTVFLFVSAVTSPRNTRRLPQNHYLWLATGSRNLNFNGILLLYYRYYFDSPVYRNELKSRSTSHPTSIEARRKRIFPHRSKLLKVMGWLSITSPHSMIGFLDRHERVNDDGYRCSMRAAKLKCLKN